MRTLRKLFLYTLMALATVVIAASTASTASAQGQHCQQEECVAVSDANGQSCWEVECQITIDGLMSLQNPPPIDTYIGRCDDVEITMIVSGSGELFGNTIESNGNTSNFGGCNYYGYGFFNDCWNYGWSGQIVGPGDESYSSYAPGNVAYSATGDFEAIFDACFQAYYDNSAGARWDSIRFGVDLSPLGDVTWSLDPQPYGYTHELDGGDWGTGTADLQIEDV